MRVLDGQASRTSLCILLRREELPLAIKSGRGEKGEGEGGCHFRVSPGGRDGGRKERERVSKRERVSEERGNTTCEFNIS